MEQAHRYGSFGMQAYQKEYGILLWVVHILSLKLFLLGKRNQSYSLKEHEMKWLENNVSKVLSVFGN